MKTSLHLMATKAFAHRAFDISHPLTIVAPMSDGADIQAAFDVICLELPRKNIRFLMIGGHAVNYYGYTRATADIDFMIASADAQEVRKILNHAGFSNIVEHKNVIFFNQPGNPVRIDFLKVEKKTLQELLLNAECVRYADHAIWLPSLENLIAMKLFALKSGGMLRREKDLTDIVHLVIENQFDIEESLKPIAEKYGSAAIWDAIQKRLNDNDYV